MIFIINCVHLRIETLTSVMPLSSCYRKTTKSILMFLDRLSFLTRCGKRKIKSYPMGFFKCENFCITLFFIMDC